jgi:hypothetical protein
MILKELFKKNAPDLKPEPAFEHVLRAGFSGKHTQIQFGYKKRGGVLRNKT